MVAMNNCPEFGTNTLDFLGRLGRGYQFRFFNFAVSIYLLRQISYLLKIICQFGAYEYINMPTNISLHVEYGL